MYKEVGVKKRTLLSYLCVKLLKFSTYEYKTPQKMKVSAPLSFSLAIISKY